MDASSFSRAQHNYYCEFEKILSKIVICHNLMIDNGIPLPNNENLIRDKLVNNYINNPKIKRKIEFPYFVFPEAQEIPTGRTDIRIQHPNSYYDQNTEYYIIECKRIDNTNIRGTTGLNALYISEGIYRFVSNYYSSHYFTNGMIGFVVEPMDIHDNIKTINHLLKNNFHQANTNREISQQNFIPDFKYHYNSEHKTKNGSRLRLYHLMFDFSSLIHQKKK